MILRRYLSPWCWLISRKSIQLPKEWHQSITQSNYRTAFVCLSLFAHLPSILSHLHPQRHKKRLRVDFSGPQWESWRLKRWGHQAAAGTALAELRQRFRYEPRRCCYQGRSYEAASVWWTRNSYCVGWPPPHQNLLSFAKSCTVPGQRAFMFSDCLVSMVTTQTAYWNQWKFSL